MDNTDLLYNPLKRRRNYDVSPEMDKKNYDELRVEKERYDQKINNMVDYMKADEKKIDEISKEIEMDKEIEKKLIEKINENTIKMDADFDDYRRLQKKIEDNIDIMERYKRRHTDDNKYLSELKISLEKYSNDLKQIDDKNIIDTSEQNKSLEDQSSSSSLFDQSSSPPVDVSTSSSVASYTIRPRSESIFLKIPLGRGGRIIHKKGD